MRTVECRHPVGLERIQDTTAGIRIELCGGTAGRHGAGGGFVLEAPRDEIERVVDKPQAIAHHCFDGLTHRAVSH